MVTLVKMPKLTWTMEEGIIGEWHKTVGDQIEKGSTLCEIETEKSVDELKAPESGILRKILFPKGSIAKVNEVIAIIASTDEELPNGIESKVEDRPLAQRPYEESPKVEEPKVSPVAKKLAEEQGIDLKQIKGTGPEGRIVREDIVKAAEKVAQVKTMPLSRMREVIKNRLTLSVKNALHVPLTMEVDMTEVLKLIQSSRVQIDREHSTHLTPTSVLVKATAEALELHPTLNARLVNEKMEIPDQINIGIAVSLEDGLVVPVVREANKKTLPVIRKEITDLAEKARKEDLSTAESTGSTFTISNLGMFEIDFFAPIINPPESAILGVGRIVKKPVVVKDEIALRSMMTLTLVFDHRIMDGAVAARFLQTLKKKLENPAKFFSG